MKLESCLARLSVAELRAIASYNSITIPPDTPRVTLHAILHRSLLDKAGVRDAVQRLDALEKEILLQVQSSGTPVDGITLRRIWGGDDTTFGNRWIWRQKTASGIPRLRLSGLMYRIQHPGDRDDYYVVPEQISRLLEHTPPDISALQLDSSPYDSSNCRTRILSDVFELVQYLEKYKVRPLNDGSLPARHRRHLAGKLGILNPVIHGSDNSGYIAFIFLCARASGLISSIRRQLRPGVSFSTWIRETPVSQMKQLYAAWAVSLDYDEFHQSLHDQIATAGLRLSPEAVRQAVLDTVAQLPESQWISIEGFNQHFRRHRPHFIRPMHDTRHWMFKSETGVPQSRDNLWQLIEETVLRFLLLGPLHWLGVTSIGLDPSGHPIAFLKTSLGDSLLKDSDWQGEEEDIQSNRILIQPDFSILIHANAVLSVKYMMDQIAEQTDSNPMLRYIVTRKSIGTAAKTGLTNEEIVSFLRSRSTNGIPQNVETSICDWHREFGKVSIRPCALLEARDEFIFEELRRIPSISGYVSEYLGRSSAVIESGQIEALLEDLERRGFNPKISEYIQITSNSTTRGLYLAETDWKLVLDLLARFLQNDGNLTVPGDRHHRLRQIYHTINSLMGRNPDQEHLGEHGGKNE